jgi:hypothetical protein
LGAQLASPSQAFFAFAQALRVLASQRTRGK